MGKKLQATTNEVNIAKRFFIDTCNCAHKLEMLDAKALLAINAQENNKDHIVVKRQDCRTQVQIKDANQKRGVYLSNITIRKIIQRFLTEKRMPKKKLTETLEINAKELEQLFVGEISTDLIRKINLPLIKLYCETKWA